MKIRATVISITIVFSVLVLNACEPSGAAGSEKVVKATKSGDTTITLSSTSGDVKSGANELLLAFTDASGNAINVPAASLKFHMPAMGAMAEMNDVATLTTTGTPGKFSARLELQMGGTWEARISFQGLSGTEHATMSVSAK